MPKKSAKRQLLTPKAQLSSTIKTARDIMRKDAGLNGDLDCIPQLAWILFLKCFDDMEERRQITEKDYRPAIVRVENELAWRVPIEKIIDGNYNLDLKNPNRKGDFTHLPPEQLIEDILIKERRIIELLGEIRDELVRPLA